MILSAEPSGPADETSTLRAIHVLERIGSPKAVAILQSLTQGTDAGPVAAAARGAIARIQNIDLQ